jgi:hypothetical protein
MAARSEEWSAFVNREAVRRTPRAWISDLCHQERKPGTPTRQGPRLEVEWRSTKQSASMFASGCADAGTAATMAADYDDGNPSQDELNCTDSPSTTRHIARRQQSHRGCKARVTERRIAPSKKHGSTKRTAESNFQKPPRGATISCASKYQSGRLRIPQGERERYPQRSLAGRCRYRFASSSWCCR